MSHLFKLFVVEFECTQSEWKGGEKSSNQRGFVPTTTYLPRWKNAAGEYFSFVFWCDDCSLRIWKGKSERSFVKK